MSQFQNLEQRIIHAYLDTFPAFVPEITDKVTVQSQEQFYYFMKRVYTTLFEHPELLYSKLNEDDYFRYRFNRAADKKPELDNAMRSDVRKLEDFVNLLFEMGNIGHIEHNCLMIGSDLKINKRYLALFEHCGLECSIQDKRYRFSGREDGLFSAWKWMSTREGASILSFSRCMFKTGYSYAGDIFARLLGDETAFAALEQHMTANGYTRIDNRDDQVALDYVKNYDRKDTKIKDSWGERSHAGISMKYYYYVDKPACISLRIPKLKELLRHFDMAEPELKEFIIESNKKCDNCRYCVQTDKTGMRELILTTVKHNQEYKLCPLFPGFNYCWDFLDGKLADNAKCYLSFIDRVLA